MNALDTLPQDLSPPARAEVPSVVPDHRFQTKGATVEVFRSAAHLPAELRAAAFAGQTRGLRYYEIAEQTLAGQFEHRYLVLRGASPGQTAVQPVFLVDQDILDGLPRRVHEVLNWPRRLFPRWLKIRMLVAGCSAGNGALDRAEPWAVAALRDALQIYAWQAGARMILLKDFPASDRVSLRPFEAGGFRRVPSMPDCALDLNFATFEDYMRDQLGRKLRYKYIKLNKRPPIEWEVRTDVTELAVEIHALYQQTHARSKMRFECLTPEFFARIGREMPESARFFLWRVDGRLAAFALCLVHGDTIHHLNIGFDYAVSLDLQLYYVTMRDIFRWSLAEGLKHYATGQLNYDPKLHFKMHLVPLDLYSRHTSPLLNPLFKLALGYLQPVRHEPIIRQFPNSAEL